MEYAVNQEVKYHGSNWTISEASRGWFTLVDEEGNKTKARAKDLAPVADREMRTQLANARKRYQKTTSYGGEVSYDNGDQLALALRGLEPAEVCAVADTVLNAGQGFHLGRYGHLNPGQQRMNAGNRIRAAVKKETVSVDLVTQARNSLSEAAGLQV